MVNRDYDVSVRNWIIRNGERERDLVPKVLEHVDARYDIEEMQLGKVYKWRPESVLIECECGQTTTLTVSDTTCEECGKEHKALLREALAEQRNNSRQRPGEEDLHPWRYDEDSKDDGDPILWV